MAETGKKLKTKMLNLKDIKTNKVIILLCLVIFCFSFFVRTIYLDSVPANLNPDEADTIQTYMRMVYEPNSKPHLFSFNWNGAPALNTFIVGLSWDIFGQTVFGARLPSAFFTSCGIVIFFILLVLVLGNVFISVLLSIALAVNPWFLSFSRSVWENGWNVLFLGFILLGYEMIQHKRHIGWIFCVAGSVVGFYAYHPGKLYIISLLTILLLYILKNKENLKKQILLLLLITISYVILISPQAISMMKNPAVALGRINTVSITQEENKKEYFIESLKNNINGLILFSPSASYIGLNSRYIPSGKPFISSIFLPFFIIGLIYALIYRKFYVWCFLILLFPVQLLSRGTPDASRAIHMVGMYYIIIGMGTMWIISKATLFMKRIKIKYLSFINILITTIFVFGVWYVVLQDLNTYASWITSKQALEAREPAVWNYEYETWKNTLMQNIKGGKGGFNVYDWKKMTGRE